MLPKIKFSDLREMYEFVDPMAKIWVWAGMGLSVKINNIQKFAYLIGKMMNQGFWMLYIALLFCFSFPIIFGQTYSLYWFTSFMVLLAARVKGPAS